MFTDMLKTQLLLTNVITPEDWEVMSEHIQYDFLYDNHFTELKEAELMNERLALAATAEPYVGKYYSQDYVRRKIIRQTDQEIIDQDKLIEQEIKDGVIPDPAIPTDPETGLPLDTLGAPVGGAEPDAALRSMNVDTAVADQDADIVKTKSKPKGGEI
jgi:hypothetical protein